MKTTIPILALVLALSLLVASVSLANGEVALRRWVLGSGAADSAASGVSLRATFGQPVVGVGSGGGVTVGQGFGHVTVLRHGVYLPVVIRD
jgi:hypothetical protein